MYKQCQRRGNLEQRKWFNQPIWSKRQIFAVFKRLSVCPHIQICIKSKPIIHHTKSIVCQTNLLMTTLAMLEHIVALLIYTKRPLGLEYFHNEIVILVNVSSCLLSRTCCRRGCYGGWHPPPRSRCVTCLLMLSADWAHCWGHRGCVSVQQPLSSGRGPGSGLRQSQEHSLRTQRGIQPPHTENKFIAVLKTLIINSKIWSSKE